jgi:TPR repeat protein
MEKATCEGDFTEAFTWFFHAAEQGHQKAQYYLGTLYATGKGITKDNIKAYSWVSVAMPNESGDGEPRKGEPRAEAAMKKIKKDLTAKELSEAIKAAEELFDNLRDIEEKNKSDSAEMFAD